MNLAGFFSENKKKIFLIYICYQLFFILSHISLISLFTFFHFLLNHGMGTIENWLNRNSWEILTLAKVLSFILVSKGMILNQYNEKGIWFYLKEKINFLSSKAWIVSFFILGVYYALITQFSSGIQANHFKEELVYASFMGSICFYFLDYVLLKVAFQIYHISKKEITRFLFPTFVVFFLASKFVLPYLDKYTIFLALNFIAIFYIGLNGSLSDFIIYSFTVVGPFSSIYGIDIVWDNAYSLFSYESNTPVFGIIVIWLIALVYYNVKNQKQTKICTH